jgi:hypothetical protein
MQNIQDVENSKKIVTMNNDLTNKTEKPNLSLDFTLDYDDVEVSSNSSNVDEVNLNLIDEEFGIHEKNVLGEVLKDNVLGEVLKDNALGSLNNEMKEIHIITNLISQTSTVVLGE